jgi:hypothetical protein
MVPLSHQAGLEISLNILAKAFSWRDVFRCLQAKLDYAVFPELKAVSSPEWILDLSLWY